MPVRRIGIVQIRPQRHGLGALLMGCRVIGPISTTMLVGTVFGLFVIPGLYYIFATIAEKYKFVKEEEENPLTEDFTHE